MTNGQRYFAGLPRINLLAKDRVSPELARLGHSFTGLGAHVKGIALGMAGAFLGIEVGGFMKSAVEEYRDAAKIGRLTNQVIGSTGGIAGVTAAHVSQLAERLQAVAGVDDDVIAGGENMLLTMTKVRNATGAGNQVFDRATAAALDMSAALGRNLNGSMLIVGRALQDPLKGMNALRRAQVMLTDDQKKAIKTMIEHHNLLGAQKIILGALEQKFKGAAAAATDPVKKAQVAWGNFKEMIGGLVFPLVAKFANFMLSDFIPGLRAMVSAFKEGDVTSDGFVGVMERVGVAGRKVWEVIQRYLVPAVRDYLWPALKSTVSTIRDFTGWLSGSTAPALALRAALVGVAAVFVAFKVWQGIMLAITIATRAWAVAQALLNAIMYANPIGLVILAVIALAAGIFYLWTHSAGFRNFFIGMWNHIWSFLKAIGSWFAGPFAGFFVRAWNTLLRGAVVFHDTVVGKFNAIVAFVRSLPGRIASAASGMFWGIVAAFRSGINTIIRLWNNFHLTLGGGSVLGMSIPSITLSTPDLPYLDVGGDILRTGLAVVHKGETVLPAGSGVRGIVLEIRSEGHSDFDRFMEHWLRKKVRVRGGGNVQLSFGRN